MHHIVYISSATLPVSEAELEQFLQRWRVNNARYGVTGILLYSSDEGRFMQVIEGEKPAILSLFSKIERDYRHRDLLKLADGSIPKRNFTTWLMGFKVLSTAAFAQLAGYVDPTSPEFELALSSTHDVLIRHLLETFTSESLPRLSA